MEKIHLHIFSGQRENSFTIIKNCENLIYSSQIYMYFYKNRVQ